MHHSSKAGFTLIELLVVISIISLLASVILASLNSANAKAKAAAVQEELAQLERQAALYYSDYGNYGPAGFNGGYNMVYPCAKDGTTGGSYPWAFSNFSSMMFGSTSANSSFSPIMSSLASASGWTGSQPTIFCIVTGIANGYTAPAASSSWAITVRDPSNPGNYFCADSNNTMRYETNPSSPNLGINYTYGSNYASCL